MRTCLTILYLFAFLFMQGQANKNEFEELATGYFNQGKFIQAAEFFSKSGYSYWNKGEKSKAAEVFQKAYELFMTQGNNKSSLVVSNNLGFIYLDEGKYSNAHQAFCNALANAEKLKNSEEIFNALLNIGTVSMELNNYSEAILRGNKALEMAKEQNNLRMLARCYSILAESHEKMGDGSNAYKFYELFSMVDKKIKSMEFESFKNLTQDEINRAHENKRVTEIELKIKKGQLKLTQDSLGIAEKLAQERQMQIIIRNAQLNEKEAQLKYEKHVRKTLILWIVFISVFLGVLAFLLRQKLKDNKVLKRQKEEITEQRNKLDLQNKKITDSIFYGLRIQQAMLPDLIKLEPVMESFIIYKPKDIVSGDFYWYYETTLENCDYKFLAVADCTGHGVPGAFMSMIGQRLLSEIVIEKEQYEPAEVLAGINNLLRKDLNQEKNKTIDGMDIAFCRIEFQNQIASELIFAGAKMNLYHYDSSLAKMNIIEGNNVSLGSASVDGIKKISNKAISIKKDDLLFLFSDGLIDQSDNKRKRFGSQKFLDIIMANINSPLLQIKENFEISFGNFIGNEEQRDDITLLGVKFK